MGIGVHAPEFAFEKGVDNVRRAAKDLRGDYPIGTRPPIPLFALKLADAALLTKGDVAPRSLEPHSSRFRRAATDQRLSADVKHCHIAPSKTEPGGALMPISFSLRTPAHSKPRQPLQAAG